MKIDRANPRHWLYLFRFGINVVLALLLRPFIRRGKSSVVILYGHRLTGNLLAICRGLERDAGGPKPIFLTMDTAYCRKLECEGERACLALGISAALVMARAQAVITDHGLHAMLPLLHLTSIRFFDVWHGIPFKGFDADDFRVQHRYDEIWVASERHRSLYTERYGFDPTRVVATGYARTDRLVTRVDDTTALRRSIGAPAEGQLILFAPTWTQDARDRSLFPFGHDEATFLGALSELAGRHGATVLMRAHLNSGTGAGSGYANVVPVPAGEHPDTEGILLVSDVLICDWSSIAFDYLLLDRPTLFLDVPSPFRKGFSLGPEYRFGAVVQRLEELLEALAVALDDPLSYWQVHGDSHLRIKSEVYESFADGGATRRCLTRLQARLSCQAPSKRR